MEKQYVMPFLDINFLYDSISITFKNQLRIIKMFTQMLYAQGGAPAGATGSPWMSILMMVAVFAIFYFLLIRPQRMQQKKLAQTIGSLKKGDKIIIAGGIIAEYVSEKEGGKIAIVKIGEDTKVEIIKSTISSVVTETIADSKKESNKINEDIKKGEEKAKKK